MSLSPRRGNDDAPPFAPTSVGAIINTFDGNNIIYLEHGTFTVHPTPPDGSCFYHALGLLAYHYKHDNAQLYFTPNGGTDVQQLRNAVAGVISERREEFYAKFGPVGTYPTFPDEMALSSHIEEVKGTKWATDVEFEAALYLFPGIQIAAWIEVDYERLIQLQMFQPDRLPKEKLQTWNIVNHLDGTHFSWVTIGGDTPAAQLPVPVPADPAMDTADARELAAYLAEAEEKAAAEEARIKMEEYYYTRPPDMLALLESNEEEATKAFEDANKALEDAMKAIQSMDNQEARHTTTMKMSQANHDLEHAQMQLALFKSDY